ncbi:hypothetical protein EHP00_1441 [Ecytonucleospora hepatopenaei]|uniref:Uncharacterized protein n=1 Tax=Ecytonucleospora hepatopenaei TaxID=646526 RepID=A0A1W0E7F1_9MICR|nr:hypothetical protein EHP00_1441 [Ecytonucleospora hepatopenaei]
MNYENVVVVRKFNGILIIFLSTFLFTVVSAGYFMDIPYVFTHTIFFIPVGFLLCLLAYNLLIYKVYIKDQVEFFKKEKYY